MGVDDNIGPLYGWSEEGCRAYGETEGFRKERRSIIAGHTPGSKQLIAPMEYQGFTDTMLFNQWLEERLCPDLRKGQYVILDNASFHKSALTEEIINKAGCHLLYLPAYSPDLNPIEHCWANFKNYLRKIIDQCTSFSEAITQAMTETFSG
jgi:transposase